MHSPPARSMCRVNLHHTFRHHITSVSLFRRLGILDIDSEGIFYKAKQKRKSRTFGFWLTITRPNRVFQSQKVAQNSPLLLPYFLEHEEKLGSEKSVLLNGKSTVICSFVVVVVFYVPTVLLYSTVQFCCACAVNKNTRRTTGTRGDTHHGQYKGTHPRASQGRALRC